MADKVTYVIIGLMLVFIVAVMNDEFNEPEEQVSYHQMSSELNSPEEK